MTTTGGILDAYTDAFNRHDLAAIDALHSFAARIEGPEGGTNVAALLSAFTYWFAQVPDVKAEVRAYAENGPVVFAEMILAGTDPAGHPVAVPVLLVIETADGLIVAERQYTPVLPPV
jgi:hypothetical protein